MLAIFDQVTTTQLTAGNIVRHSGLYLKLEPHRLRPAPHLTRFRGLVLNYEALLRHDSIFARFEMASVWPATSPIPHWTVEGDAAKLWDRAMCSYAPGLVMCGQPATSFTTDPASGLRCPDHAAMANTDTVLAGHLPTPRVRP